MLKLEFALLTVGIALAMFLALVLCLELGRRLEVHQTSKHGSEARKGVGVVDSAVYGLLALLLGFSFSGAASRFDRRRELILDVVNVAGTAWQRIDILPAELQPPIRVGLRSYVDHLIGWYSGDWGYKNLVEEPPDVTRAQSEVWSRSVAACAKPPGDVARMLLLPALNELFGAVEKERMARRSHPPWLMWLMLGITALAAAVFAGYALPRRRNWLYILGLAASISIAMYVTIELEYPRLGFVRVDATDQTLIELRKTMN